MKVLLSCLMVPGTFQMGLSMCQELIRRGHRVMTIVDKNIEKRLRNDPMNAGLEYFVLSVTMDDSEMMVEFTQAASLSYEENCKMLPISFKYFLDQQVLYKPEVERAVSEFCPDLILLDHGATVPYLVNKGIKWGHIISLNILSLDHNQLPPMFAGLSTRSKNYEQWNECRNILYKHLQPVYDHIRNYSKEHGVEQQNVHRAFDDSPYFNFYCLPLELDYFAENEISLTPNWYRFDSLVRQESPCDLEIRKLLPNLPGKLIYFSMGTLASKDLKFMQTCFHKLSQISHRFIVSTGAFGDQLTLPSNCYGRQYWPQTHVLREVELFITHAGNNSWTEALCAGVGMIAMPVFLDQLDNAQRLVDCNLGLRLHPLHFTVQELQNAIDSMFNDQERLGRIKAISERVAKTNNVGKACDILEKVAQSENVTTNDVLSN